MTIISNVAFKNKKHSWLAVIAIGLATFSVVTTEMLPVGLLTAISNDLGTTTGIAGLMISLPALLAAVFAPLVVISAGNIDRRKVLCALLCLLIIANVASTLAPSTIWILGARILVGFCMGGIWAIAGGLAARLVPEKSIGLATSIIFGGVAAASVLGVPLGAFIGDLAGWRWAFGSMAILSALVLILHLCVVPTLPVHDSVTIKQFKAQLSNSKLRIGLFLTFIIVAGHFMAFTFISPLLLSISGFDTKWLSALLFAYGIAGIIGNFIIGMIATKHTFLSLMFIALGLFITPILFLTIGSTHLGGIAVLVVWGLAYGGVSVGLMTWMMKVAPRAVEIATALYVGVFNIGIFFGSWVGGQVVDHLGLSFNLWLTLALTALASILVFTLDRLCCTKV